MAEVKETVAVEVSRDTLALDAQKTEAPAHTTVDQVPTETTLLTEDTVVPSLGVKNNSSSFYYFCL